VEIYSRHATRFSWFGSISFGLVMFGLLYALSGGFLVPILFAPLLIPISHRLMMRRYHRRRLLVKESFPQAWREILEVESSHYRMLDSKDQHRFEQLVQAFLAEQAITGVEPVVVTDRLRLMVAAGAVTLVFHRPAWEYRNLREILIYSGAFDLDSFKISARKPILGLVGWQSPVILSQPHLEAGFNNPREGSNLVIHEFAHVIDLHDVGSSEHPLHLSLPHKLVKQEISRIHRGDSILGDYAATNEAEFFAVSTEVFFTQPVPLKRRHPELYTYLCRLYDFDPAATGISGVELPDQDSLAGYSKRDRASNWIETSTGYPDDWMNELGK
jgi:MtfA peptidase